MADKSTLILPILLITIGAGWLLTSLGLMPGIDWIWTMLLAAVGVLTLALGGINKATVTIGPFFIIASFLSILRQNGKIELNVELPILVIVTGVCLLVSRSPRIPLPAWAKEPRPAEKRP